MLRAYSVHSWRLITMSSGILKLIPKSAAIVDCPATTDAN
jgi:hypothetical protein